MIFDNEGHSTHNFICSNMIGCIELTYAQQLCIKDCTWKICNAAIAETNFRTFHWGPSINYIGRRGGGG